VKKVKHNYMRNRISKDLPENRVCNSVYSKNKIQLHNQLVAGVLSAVHQY
jgi:hypothetical protein